MIVNFIIINNSEHMNNQNEKQHKCDKRYYMALTWSLAKTGT